MRKHVFPLVLLFLFILAGCQKPVSTVKEETRHWVRPPYPTFTPTLLFRPTQVHGPALTVTLTDTPVPTVTPTVDPEHCAPHPCPAIVGSFAKGCFCGGETYRAESNEASYCCDGHLQPSPCPAMIAKQAMRLAFFGGPGYWDIQQQIVPFRLRGYPIWVHRKALPAFEQVNAAIENMAYQIREPVGSWVWRNVSGTNLISTHAFGIAVDINPSTNPRCGVTSVTCCYYQLLTDMPPEFVQAFKDAGFVWGGDWQEHPDPMHFEWAGWLSRSEVTDTHMPQP